MTVYRLVQLRDTDDPRFADSFLSNRARNRPPRLREIAIPEVHEAVSMYKERQQAGDLWRAIKEKHPNPRIGNYIAEVRLGGREGFFIEDLDEPDGHVEVWGDPVKLAQAVVEVHSMED